MKGGCETEDYEISYSTSVARAEPPVTQSNRLITLFVATRYQIYQLHKIFQCHIRYVDKPYFTSISLTTADDLNIVVSGLFFIRYP